jgi:hypothetical protein
MSKCVDLLLRDGEITTFPVIHDGPRGSHILQETSKFNQNIPWGRQNLPFTRSTIEDVLKQEEQTNWP